MTTDDPHEPPPNPPSPSTSANSLSQRLAAARDAQRERERGPYRAVSDQKTTRWTVMAMRLMVDMIAAVAVGGALGYALDTWLGTQPILFAVLLLFGVAAGMLNMYRTLTSAPGYSKRGAPRSLKGAAGMEEPADSASTASRPEQARRE